MANDATIYIRFKADAAPVQKAADDASRKVSSFGEKFKATFAGVLSANLVQNLAGKIFDFGKQSVQAYEKSQETQTKFLDSMSRIPGASAATTKALLDQAAALSQTTIYGKGASKQALATLASYGLNGDQLKQLLPLVQDYAAKTGADLPTAAQQVGKAMLGQGRALKSVGINFKDTKTLAGNFAEVTAGLGEKVGGLAEKMGGTEAGKMKIMENNVTALKVALGAGLVPAIEAVLPVLMPLLQFIAANSKWLVPLAAGIIAVSVAFKILNGAMALLGLNPATWIILAIAVGIVALIVALYLLWRNWDTVWNGIKAGAQAVWDFMQTVWHGILAVIQAVWDWIKTNWPLLLPILFGPIGIAAALIITYWDQIKAGALAVWRWITGIWGSLFPVLIWPINAAWGVIQAVWGAIRASVSAIAAFIGAVWNSVYAAITGPISRAASWVSGKVSEIGGWFASVAGKIASALSGVFDAIIGPFKRAWDWIQSNILGPLKGAWNTVAHAINSVHIHASIPSNPITDFLHIGGKGFDWEPPFKVPTLQSGGLVTRTGFILAHAGEAVTPLPAGALRPGGGPLVQIMEARFSERVDVDAFGKRLAWTIQASGV